MKTEKKSVVFLLGSGASQPSGMPSTDTITEAIEAGHNVITNNQRYFAANIDANDENAYLNDVILQSDQDQRVKPIVRFISTLKEMIMEVQDKANYEDIYYAVNQISGDIDNPLIKPAIDMLKEKTLDLAGNCEEASPNPYTDLSILAEHSEYYIEDMVANLLSKEPNNLDYYQFIRDAKNDDEIDVISIATLNHDKNIELYLTRQEIGFADGFNESENEIRYWNSSIFETTDKKVRLLKLHGSINWRRYRYENGSLHGDRYGIALSGFSNDDNSSASSNIEASPDGKPNMLIGVHNKMLKYIGGIFGDLQYHFLTALRKARLLVVCGYGFRDKGMNNHIIDWLNSSLERRMMIYHPAPEELFRGARLAIKNNINNWDNQGSLFVVKKNVESISWNEIKEIHSRPNWRDDIDDVSDMRWRP
jgi:hypothetical protein